MFFIPAELVDSRNHMVCHHSSHLNRDTGDKEKLTSLYLKLKSGCSPNRIIQADRSAGNEKHVILNRTITIFGITEAEAGEHLSEVEAKFHDIQVGTRFSFPEIRATFYASGDDKTAVQERLTAAANYASEVLAPRVFSMDGDAMETVVGNLLIEHKATVGVAESCTGGLISHLLTNVPGSSQYFVFSGITYANEAKIKVLGVDADTIDEYGAVHEKTAQQMAEGVRRISGSTYGLSTSGIAGPDGGTVDKPVGTVCIGLATPSKAIAKRYQFHYPERIRNKKIFTMTALDLLRRELLKNTGL